MWRRWLIIFSTLFLICLTSCTSKRETVAVAGFAELDAQIADGVYGDINSLLIWHDGEMVHESYYRGIDAETMNQIYSVTKSITSAMIGRAIEEGHIASIDEKMIDYFVGYETIFAQDGRKQKITLEDLLTMRGGFAWDELSAIYGQETNDVTSLIRANDWVQYVLEQELATEPGTTFSYNSGITMLLGSILQDATGETAESYTKENLFEPLGIEKWQWRRTPNRTTNTGWGLFLRPTDMIKFGQLYLQEGEWEGEQIIPSAWVAQSTAPTVRIDDAYDYGYQWWRFADENEIVADLDENDLYFAWGFGGNFIFVVPHLDLVVVATAENFEDSAQFFPILSEFVFPQFAQ